MLLVLCVPQLGSKSISVMKVRDFLCADDCVILPVCRDEQKLRTVYECCRGLHCCPSLPENPREVSRNWVLVSGKLSAVWKRLISLVRDERKTEKLFESSFLVCWFRARGYHLSGCLVSSWPCAFLPLQNVFWTKLESFIQLNSVNRLFFIHRLRICWNQPGVTVSNTKNWGVD